MSKQLTILFIITLLISSSVSAGIVKGTIFDSGSHEPIAYATIRVIGTGQSISANENGNFRIKLTNGQYQLKFSHIAHYSQILEINIADSLLEQDVYLEPALIEVTPIKVYDKQYDAAQRIIVEAIARKDELLSKLKEYSFDAYTKLILRDTGKSDSAEIAIITETQLSSYWKYPDKYKEILTARKQSSNVPAEGNLVTVGEILNFNKNRLDMGIYSVVSPTAKDALDYYNYYLMDSIIVDNNLIFVLEIEPKNNFTPLLQGTIKIVDTTFAVVGVDVSFNKGFDVEYIYNPRFIQTYAEFGNNYWMPTLIQFRGIVDLKMPIIPVYSFDYTAALHQYNFEPNLKDDFFDEYAIEVAPTADDIDSTEWASRQMVPLTDDELYGYYRIDSLENAPKPIHKKLLNLSLGFLMLTTGKQDLFHFNRVEGAYLGLGHRFERIKDRWDFSIKSGYAFDAEFWQHRYGIDYLLDKKHKIYLGTEYRNEIRTIPTVFAPENGNPTFMTLLSKTDAYDYYREEGFLVKIKTNLLKKTSLSIQYNHYHQRSIAVNSDYSIFNIDEIPRINPAIADGNMRSVTTEFSYDSRDLIKNKGRERKIGSITKTLFKIGMEYSPENLFDNDYDFSRYYLSIDLNQRLSGMGLSSLYLYAGASDKNLPAQRYYNVDFDNGLTGSSLAFRTMGDNNFSGSRVLAIYGSHDFERILFKRSGIPLVKDIPLSLSIHGGMFWTDFDNIPVHPGDVYYREAKTPYSEIGFGIGRLLPFGLELDFTWQISAYNTNKFSFNIAGGFFDQ